VIRCVILLDIVGPPNGDKDIFAGTLVLSSRRALVIAGIHQVLEKTCCLTPLFGLVLEGLPMSEAQ
jgi:hypothetical protein